MRTRARLDQIEQRLDKIAEQLDSLYGVDFQYMQGRYLPSNYVKRYERIPRIEKQVSLILDHLGLEVEKVPAIHEHFRLRKKIGWGFGSAEESEAETK